MLQPYRARRIVTRAVSFKGLARRCELTQTDVAAYQPEPDRIRFVAVDAATGVISFLPGHVPETGAAITAGFEFDVPCRFDTDFLDTRIEGYQRGSSEVNIIEVRI